MTNESAPVEVTFRNMEPENRVKDYIDHKLGEPIRSIPNLRWASVEVSFEDTKAAEQRYVVQVTLAANGAQLRAEDRGPDPLPAIDRTHDLLQRRIRDWKGHVYFDKRQQAAEYKEMLEMEAASLPPEDKSDLIVRVKGHEVEPMAPEDAAVQMELLGHDFFFFLNSDTDQYNVVYRRKAGGYGLIEPR